MTGPRQAILDRLRHGAHPLTIKEIFAALPKGLCDLVTVYRSIHLLESMGMKLRLYSVKRGETMVHDVVGRIKAPLASLPETTSL